MKGVPTLVIIVDFEAMPIVRIIADHDTSACHLAAWLEAQRDAIVDAVDAGIELAAGECRHVSWAREDVA